MHLYYVKLTPALIAIAMTCSCNNCSCSNCSCPNDSCDCGCSKSNCSAPTAPLKIAKTTMRPKSKAARRTSLKRSIDYDRDVYYGLVDNPNGIDSNPSSTTSKLSKRWSATNLADVVIGGSNIPNVYGEPKTAPIAPTSSPLPAPIQRPRTVPVSSNYKLSLLRSRTLLAANLDPQESEEPTEDVAMSSMENTSLSSPENDSSGEKPFAIRNSFFKPQQDSPFSAPLYSSFAFDSLMADRQQQPMQINSLPASLDSGSSSSPQSFSMIPFHTNSSPTISEFSSDGRRGKILVIGSAESSPFDNLPRNSDGEFSFSAWEEKLDEKLGKAGEFEVNLKSPSTLSSGTPQNQISSVQLTPLQPISPNTPKGQGIVTPTGVEKPSRPLESYGENSAPTSLPGHQFVYMHPKTPIAYESSDSSDNEAVSYLSQRWEYGIKNLWKDKLNASPHHTQHAFDELKFPNCPTAGDSTATFATARDYPPTMRRTIASRFINTIRRKAKSPVVEVPAIASEPTPTTDVDLKKRLIKRFKSKYRLKRSAMDSTSSFKE
uniref:ARAD1A07656p n=1 Tax=Blastobotrys adeninivorans TaxID=409370 RepID=A0A060SXV6_BLAAD